MKPILFAFATLLLVPAAASARPLEWSGVQAVGGLKVGTPHAQSGQWYVPVEADVSGRKGGTQINSGLVCSKVNVRLDSGTLLLTLNTTVAGSMGSGHSAQCPPVKLGHIKAGSYDVVYRSPSEPDQVMTQIAITP